MTCIISEWASYLSTFKGYEVVSNPCAVRLIASFSSHEFRRTSRLCLIALVQLYQLWVFVIWRTMSSNVEKLLLRWTKGKKIENYLIPETIGDPLMCSTKTGTVRLHHFVYRLPQRDLQCFYWCNRLKAIMAYLLIALCSASQRCAPSHICDFVTL